MSNAQAFLMAADYAAINKLRRSIRDRWFPDTPLRDFDGRDWVVTPEGYRTLGGVEEQFYVVIDVVQDEPSWVCLSIIAYGYSVGGVSLADLRARAALQPDTDVRALAHTLTAQMLAVGRRREVAYLLGEFEVAEIDAIDDEHLGVFVASLRKRLEEGAIR